jgi:hypothetical protein
MMTRGQAKPGIDWLEIRKRVEGGEGIRPVARDYGISHQSIQGKAQRQGWTGGWAGARRTQIMQAVRGNGSAADSEPNEGKRQLPALPKGQTGLRTEENKVCILECLKIGFSINKAASVVGFTDPALRSWMQSDETWRQELIEAQLHYAARHMGNIDAASDRGDWKASERLLESHPFMRDEFKPADKGGGITVIINVPRPDMKEIGQIIDMEPEEVA